MKKIYIPQQWIQEYKNTLLEMLYERLGEEGSDFFDWLEDKFPNLNFSNPEYEYFYCRRVSMENFALLTECEEEEQ